MAGSEYNFATADNRWQGKTTVSDLLIVYTGNSYTDNFVNKNRGVVVKLSYWFN